MPPLEFPSSPANGATNAQFQYDASITAWRAQGSTQNVGTAIANLQAADAILSQPGRIISTYYVGLKAPWGTTSTTYVDIGGLGITVTPKSATSKFLLMANVAATNITGGRGVHLRFGGGNASSFVGDAASLRFRSAASGAFDDMTKAAFVYSFSYLDSPATTSPITYSVQTARGDAGTAYINISTTDGDTGDWGRPTSSFTILEVAA